MRTLIVLTVAVVAQVLGNICLSKGMKCIAASQSDGGLSLLTLVLAMGNPLVWVGTFLLILFLVLFSAALSWEDLSFVLPATAFEYVLNVFFAYQFLNEPVSTARWVGTGFIFIGVLLVTGSGRGRSRQMEMNL